ncbi:hypothetical protein MASR2M18_13250 [Ignavibacteria bacterium]|nr:hypothetical protein [Bacteroidota bacterium]MCZ2132304.1 hypothetical protein [Bacteroidota bacterium]
MKITANDVLFTLAILFAVWFTVLGIVWVYWFALIFAYPFGIASLVIWSYIKKDGKKRNKIIPVILIVGLLCSFSSLGYILISQN